MKKHIYNEEGTRLIRTEEDEPVCGRDYCDTCGDCLACYDPDSPCIDERGHTWVVYGNNEKKEA